MAKVGQAGGRKPDHHTWQAGRAGRGRRQIGAAWGTGQQAVRGTWQLGAVVGAWQLGAVRGNTAGGAKKMLVLLLVMMSVIMMACGVPLNSLPRLPHLSTAFPAYLTSPFPPEPPCPEPPPPHRHTLTHTCLVVKLPELCLAQASFSSPPSPPHHTHTPAPPSPPPTCRGGRAV